MMDEYQLKAIPAEAAGHEIWQAILDMVKGISEALLSSLPNFWRIAKGYMDGKYKKVGGMVESVNILSICRTEHGEGIAAQSNSVSHNGI